MDKIDQFTTFARYHGDRLPNTGEAYHGPGTPVIIVEFHETMSIVRRVGYTNERIIVATANLKPF